MTAEKGVKLLTDMFKPEEWWNGHEHLARQIGSMAILHRQIGCTYPPELTPEEWQGILTSIGEPLLAYADGIDDLEGYAERQAAAKEAVELFANWFDRFTY